jgi:DNA-binding beta-propeller fold protein YncE
MEVCGSKYILCDDKDSVSILDAQSLQKIKSFPLDDGQYLYSAFYQENKNTIYAAFDNGSYWVIDADKMVIRTRGLFPRACMKFVAYDSDSKTLLCACEASTLLIFNTDTN